MTGSEELRQLVAACLTGDPQAVRLFVERFQGLVFGLCRQMLRHQHDAEDVAQEAMVRAVRHLSQWDSTRPIEPWLLAIAGNRCRTALERRSRRPVPVDVLPETAAASIVAPTGVSEEVQLAVDGLRDDYRMCFSLFHLQEMSVQEIAELIHVPPGTVKTWLHRARKELAETLSRRGVTAE